MNTNHNNPDHINRFPDKSLTDSILKLEIHQLYWLHGLISGIIENQNPELIAVTEKQKVTSATEFAVDRKILVLYATQSGNSRKIATKLQSEALKRSIPMEIVDMAEYKSNLIQKEKTVLIICSTQGEGDPPLAAEEFYEYINSTKLSSLKDLQFAVLALGDKSYLHFCKTGKDIHDRLMALGALALMPITECDVDYQSVSDVWIEQIIDVLNTKAINLKTEHQHIHLHDKGKNSQTETFIRNNPGSLRVTETLNLNGRGSNKSTTHVELADDSATIQYQPGDALAIYFRNPPELINEIIVSLGLKADQPVSIHEKEEITLSDYLQNKAEITQLTREVIEKYNRLLPNKQLEQVINDTRQLQKFLYENDLLQLLTDYPVMLEANDLVQIVPLMKPRLYSIASSPNYSDNEVHLAIAELKYEYKHRNKVGACSSYIANRLTVGQQVPAFVQSNENFRLPDTDSDIIMIGPGTGIAPFRSFMQERDITGARGRNWLFFGEQHFTTDFLYQLEWQRWKKKGILARLDVAFSRDQPEKLYVQHLMMQQSKEIYDWLEKGAHIYVCGNKDKMARDVYHSLASIIKINGNLTDENTAEYLKNLKKSRRFHEDVY